MFSVQCDEFVRQAECILINDEVEVKPLSHTFCREECHDGTHLKTHSHADSSKETPLLLIQTQLFLLKTGMFFPKVLNLGGLFFQLYSTDVACGINYKGISECK